LKNGVRPFVEISFMPKKLALRQDVHPFWYKQIVSPPKDYTKWDDLMRAFAQHLVDRYGVDEVAQWYFEVWNEPNIDFWTGDPKQATYFELHDHTARALKSVNSRLRVGGPATSSKTRTDLAKLLGLCRAVAFAAARELWRLGKTGLASVGWAGTVASETLRIGTARHSLQRRFIQVP